MYSERELLDVYGAKILWPDGKFSFFQTDQKILYTPALDPFIMKWAKEHAKENISRITYDLLPRKVGIVKIVKYNSLDIVLDYAWVSWAQIEVMAEKEIAEKIGRACQFDVLAVSCLLETSDQKFIMAYRSPKVRTHPNKYHVSPTGYIDRDAFIKTEDPCGQVLLEIKEELNIESHEIENVTALGVCAHTPAHQTFIDCCYWAKTKLSASEVLSRAQSAQDSWEGKQKIFTREELCLLLEKGTMVPSGAAVLYLFLNL